MTARPLCADLDILNPCEGQTGTWPTIGQPAPVLPDTGAHIPITAPLLTLTVGVLCLAIRRFHDDRVR